MVSLDKVKGTLGVGIYLKKIKKIYNLSLKYMFVILSISDSDKHWNKVVEEYTKRLGKSVKIENIKPSRKGNTTQMIQADTENVITRLEKFSEYKKVLLSKEGKQMDTLALHKNFTDKDCMFVIGWPYGLNELELSKYIDAKISFGAITLPHGLAKVTLLEQLYRIGMIAQGKKYHY